MQCVISNGYVFFLTQLFKMEDVSMGMWVEKFNTTRQPVEYLHDVRFYQPGCFDGYFTAHYQSPQHMICLWRKLQAGSAQCCNVRWQRLTHPWRTDWSLCASVWTACLGSSRDRQQGWVWGITLWTFVSCHHLFVHSFGQWLIQLLMLTLEVHFPITVSVHVKFIWPS